MRIMKGRKKKMNGKTIKFTGQEREELIRAVEALLETFADCDESERTFIDESLDNGLGSAMRKLTRGLEAERLYKEYKFKK